MRLIDADKLEIDYSGLAYIPSSDVIGTVLYFVDQINKAPTVYPKYGHWTKINSAGIYECSECKHVVKSDFIEAYKYCPECGAKMKEYKEDLQSE